MENKLQKRDLPTIEQLYKENDKVILAQSNNLNKLMNNPPLDKWLKKHPIAKKKVNGVQVPIDYIPIERVEWLLTSIFINWYSEVKEVQLIAHSICVTVRLFYQSPITGEMIWQDGVGACPLQTDSGASASDWSKIKSSSVQIAAPAAESYAIKDAAEKIGRIFGKDLNRADQIGYDNLDVKFKESNLAGIEFKKQVSEQLSKFKDKDSFDYNGIEMDIFSLKELCVEKENAQEFTNEFGNEILKTLHNGKRK
jgi:hypothetical protein